MVMMRFTVVLTILILGGRIAESQIPPFGNRSTVAPWESAWRVLLDVLSGLLIGLLGRERTYALLFGEIEESSDVRGMLYEQVIDVKNDALKIARVLKHAGYSVDASKLV